MRVQPTLQQRFARAAVQVDVSNAVQIARDEVRHALAASSGIDIPETVDVLVKRLAGEPPPGPPSHVLMAAVCVGIAIGQLYHPDVFATGGRR